MSAKIPQLGYSSCCPCCGKEFDFAGKKQLASHWKRMAAYEAAPEMFAALEKIATTIYDAETTTTREQIHEYISTAKSAIARAKGEKL